MFVKYYQVGKGINNALFCIDVFIYLKKLLEKHILKKHLVSFAVNYGCPKANFCKSSIQTVKEGKMSSERQVAHSV